MEEKSASKHRVEFNQISVTYFLSKEKNVVVTTHSQKGTQKCI